jgi:hypothetical protein
MMVTQAPLIYYLNLIFGEFTTAGETLLNSDLIPTPRSSEASYSEDFVSKPPVNNSRLTKLRDSNFTVPQPCLWSDYLELCVSGANQPCLPVQLSRILHRA